MNCKHCGDPLPEQGRGRKRLYCSAACRRADQTDHRPKGVRHEAICAGYDRNDFKCHNRILVGGPGRPYPYCSHECFKGHRRIKLNGPRRAENNGP